MLAAVGVLPAQEPARTPPSGGFPVVPGVWRLDGTDPTLATFNFIRQKDGVLSQEFAAVADHVPPDVRRGFYAAQMKIPDDQTLQRYEKSYAKMVEFVGRLYRAGVPLVAGTDELAGFTLQAELEMLVKYFGEGKYNNVSFDEYQKGFKPSW